MQCLDFHFSEVNLQIQSFVKKAWNPDTHYNARIQWFWFALFSIPSGDNFNEFRIGFETNFTQLEVILTTTERPIWEWTTRPNSTIPYTPNNPSKSHYLNETSFRHTYKYFQQFHSICDRSPKLQIISNILGFENWLVSAKVLTGRQLSLCHLTSASKSRTINLVSSVPFRDPTAQTWVVKKTI